MSSNLWNSLPSRVRTLTPGVSISEDSAGPIIYWMSRDQRVHDNWALLYAQHLAEKYSQPLAVVFCLSPGFLGATLRQYDWMLSDLEEVSQTLADLNIPFFVLMGESPEVLPAWIKEQKVSTVVTDFSPLRIARAWKEKVGALLQQQNIPLYEVDAHNTVPAWIASPKEEYSAATFRPKIQKLVPVFLTNFPKIQTHKTAWPRAVSMPKWSAIRDQLTVDTSVEPITWLKPGESAAQAQLNVFLSKRLPNYAEARNDAMAHGQSDLSPYLHFGQISAQRVLWELDQVSGHELAKEAFRNEILIWRELAENFCFYQKNYDSFDGARNWARKTLDAARSEAREFLYTQAQFDKAKTHDPLWNAAQKELRNTGKMHGYMRMYWAKKILEWSATPEDAIATAIFLNDRYELDGRDPNGYAGIMWSIAGVHDRPWFGRPVFGAIRFMAKSGAKKKFDVAAYCAQHGETWA